MGITDESEIFEAESIEVLEARDSLLKTARYYVGAWERALLAEELLDAAMVRLIAHVKIHPLSVKNYRSYLFLIFRNEFYKFLRENKPIVPLEVDLPVEDLSYERIINRVSSELLTRRLVEISSPLEIKILEKIQLSDKTRANLREITRQINSDGLSITRHTILLALESIRRKLTRLRDLNT